MRVDFRSSSKECEMFPSRLQNKNEKEWQYEKFPLSRLTLLALAIVDSAGQLPLLLLFYCTKMINLFSSLVAFFMPCSPPKVSSNNMCVCSSRRGLKNSTHTRFALDFTAAKSLHCRCHFSRSGILYCNFSLVIPLRPLSVF